MIRARKVLHIRDAAIRQSHAYAPRSTRSVKRWIQGTRRRGTDDTDDMAAGARRNARRSPRGKTHRRQMCAREGGEAPPRASSAFACTCDLFSLWKYEGIVLYEGDTVTRVSRVGARREETQRREETRRKFVTRVLHRLDGRYFFQSRDGPSLGAISRRARWVRRAMFKAIRDTFSAFRRQGQVRDWRNGRAGAPSTRTSTSRPA